MTVCIAGVFRGGTTMVAAMIHALGIDLGPHDELRRGFSFEDLVMRAGSTQERVAYIEERNKEKDIWGWKNPSALNNFKETIHELRNPRFVVVVRDTLAVVQSTLRVNQTLLDRDPDDLSKSEEIQSKYTIFDVIDQTRQLEKRTWDFLKSSTPDGPWPSYPVLLVSYERAIVNKEAFVDEVIEFLGIAPSSEQRQDAIDRVNERGGYLHSGDKDPFEEDDDRH